MNKKGRRESPTPAKPCLVVDKDSNIYKRVDSTSTINKIVERVEIVTADCVFPSIQAAKSAIWHTNEYLKDSGKDPKDLFLEIKVL